MKLLVCLSLSAVVILLLIHIAYHIQINKACKELEFILSQKTNQKLSTQGLCRELNKLLGMTNELLRKEEKDIQVICRKEKVLRETIANLSHDIRTPLTSLHGYFQLLRQAKTEEEEKRYLSIMEGRIHALRELLEELFTYARLQDDAYEMGLEDMDFSAAVQTTLVSFYDACIRQKITPEIDICESPMPVLSNWEAVSRILQNIIKNALEHGSGELSFSLYEKGNRACFCCRNSVDQAENIEMENVFLRFYKADQARSHTSTGLGLSIARQLTEKAGGSISAELQEDRFSITVSFPLQNTSY